MSCFNLRKNLNLWLHYAPVLCVRCLRTLLIKSRLLYTTGKETSQKSYHSANYHTFNWAEIAQDYFTTPINTKT